MRGVLKRTAAAVALILTVVTAVPALCSCSALLDALNEIESAVNGLAEVTSAPEEFETPPKPVTTGAPDGQTAPFSRTPEIPAYRLPEEQFDDDLEKEAAGIIDAAIEKAVAYVNVMRDARHSFEAFGFEEDANGFKTGLSASAAELCGKAVESALRFERLNVEGDGYAGDLKADYFAVHAPLTYVHPDIASYFTIDVRSTIDVDGNSHYRLVFDRYFDPERDGNATERDGFVTLEEIKHRAGLLDRVVKRVVRLMPEGLSAYDMYYYLAAVLSEKTVYDKRPDNCFTAYGALVTGKAVCEGYTAAYYLLCREAGLWCAYRDGHPQGQGHTWNMVKLDTGIYNVDVTWCDGYGKPFEKEWYGCFMKTDADFENDGHAALADSPVKGSGTGEPDPYTS